jgi:hypothetical protein
VTVLSGVALARTGDIVEADLAREAADGVLGELRALHVGRDGGITLEAIDTTLSDVADAAEEAAPGDSADAVVWDELLKRTGEASRLSISFQVFLTIACVLAGVSLLTASPVTLVGAMVLSPEFRSDGLGRRRCGAPADRPGAAPSRCSSASRSRWRSQH